MAATRRTQILMEPEEFHRLRALARRRRTSVDELVRKAVRETYLEPSPDRGPIVEEILRMDLLLDTNVFLYVPAARVHDAGRPDGR
ncbi:MAG: hypothetical protein DMF49_04950 [Acidobacteria bacterium]|nr:MAG: hypothetical protein DMF49_04950 [Acidobacteriota bacterium]